MQQIELTYQQYKFSKNFPSDNTTYKPNQERNIHAQIFQPLHNITRQVKLLIRKSSNLHSQCNARYLHIENKNFEILTDLQTLKKSYNQLEKWYNAANKKSRMISFQNQKVTIHLLFSKLEIQRLRTNQKSLRQKQKQLNNKYIEFENKHTIEQGQRSKFEEENIQLKKLIIDLKNQLTGASKNYEDLLLKQQNELNNRLKITKKQQKLKLKKKENEFGMKHFKVKCLLDLFVLKNQQLTQRNYQLQRQVTQNQKNKDNQINLLNQQLEQSKSNFQRDKIQSTKYLQQKIQQYNVNQETLTNQLKNLGQQNLILKNKNYQLLQKNNSFELQQQNYQRQIKRLHNQNSILLEQLEKMKEEIIKAKEDLKTAKQKHIDCDIIIQQLRCKNYIQQKNIQNLEKNQERQDKSIKEMRAWLNQKQELVEKLNWKLTSLQQSLIDNQNFLKQSQKNKCNNQLLIEQLKGNVRILNDDKQDLSNKLKLCYRKIDDLQNQNMDLQRTIQRNNFTKRELQFQIQELRKRPVQDQQQLIKLHRLIDQFRNRIIFLQNQHKCLMLFYKQKLKQVDYWKLAYTNSGIEQLRSNLIKYKSQCDQLRLKQLNLKGMIKILQTKLEGKINEMNITIKQIDNLNNLLMKKNQQINDLQKVIYDLKNQSIVNLNRLKDLQWELNQLKKVKDPLLQEIDSILYGIINQVPKREIIESVYKTKKIITKQTVQNNSTIN